MQRPQQLGSSSCLGPCFTHTTSMCAVEVTRKPICSFEGSRITLGCAVNSLTSESREGSQCRQVGTSDEDGTAGSHQGLEIPPEGSGCCEGLHGLVRPNGRHSMCRFFQLHCLRAFSPCVDELGLGVDYIIVQNVPFHSLGRIIFSPQRWLHDCFWPMK